MQPHLKKCFEGIAKLEFTEKQEVVSMISSEKEVVPFSSMIVPAEAKVCVHMCVCVCVLACLRACVSPSDMHWCAAVNCHIPVWQHEL